MRMQDDARFALQQIAFDLNMAGHYAELLSPASVIPAIPTSGDDDATCAKEDDTDGSVEGGCADAHDAAAEAADSNEMAVDEDEAGSDGSDNSSTDNDDDDPSYSGEEDEEDEYEPPIPTRPKTK